MAKTPRGVFVLKTPKQKTVRWAHWAGHLGQMGGLRIFTKWAYLPCDKPLVNARGQTFSILF